MKIRKLKAEIDVNGDGDGVWDLPRGGRTPYNDDDAYGIQVG